MNGNNPLRTRRRDIALVLAAILFLVLAGSWVILRVDDPAAQEHAKRLPDYRPGPDAPAQGDAEASATAAAMAGRSHEALMRFFSAYANEPLAASFVKECLREPGLASAWITFTLDHDIQGLLRAARKNPAFQRHLTRYAKNPQFRMLMEIVSTQPSIAAVLEAEGRGARTPEAGAGARQAETGEPGADAHAVERLETIREAKATESSAAARLLELKKLPRHTLRLLAMTVREQGDVRTACDRAGLGAVCELLAGHCPTWQACERWFAAETGESFFRLAGITEGLPARNMPEVGAVAGATPLAVKSGAPPAPPAPPARTEPSRCDCAMNNVAFPVCEPITEICRSSATMRICEPIRIEDDECSKLRAKLTKELLRMLQEFDACMKNCSSGLPAAPGPDFDSESWW